ncbi:MAG: YhjD/YihY/BrkB family envelope integrity protein [Bacteroidota bacterium]
MYRNYLKSALRNFSRNKVYGSIGTFLIYMIWIFAVSMVILLGFEWNVSTIEAHEQKKESLNEDDNP